MALTIIQIALALAPIPALAATLFLYRLHHSIEPRSWVARTFFVVALISVPPTLYVSAIAIVAITQVAALPDWTALGLGVALFLFAAIPPVLADEIRRRWGLSLRDVWSVILGRWHA